MGFTVRICAADHLLHLRIRPHRPTERPARLRLAIQALSGLMSITGPVEGPPCKVGVGESQMS